VIIVPVKYIKQQLHIIKFLLPTDAQELDILFRNKNDLIFTIVFLLKLWLLRRSTAKIKKGKWCKGPDVSEFIVPNLKFGNC
jgi:hypothetical protein